MSKTLEWSVLVTLALAVVAFAFWLGALNNTVANLKPSLDAQKREALEEINSAQKDVLKSLAGAIGITNTLSENICTQGTSDCHYVATPDKNPVVYDLPVDVPPNRKLLGAWCEPIGEPSQLSGFSQVFVSLSPTAKNIIQLHLQRHDPVPLQMARMFIFGIYGPE